MGYRGTSVRKKTRGGVLRLVIDFYHTDLDGVRRRFRKDADVQTMTAAKAEADRLMRLAAETGSDAGGYALSHTFRIRRGSVPLVLPRYKKSTRTRYEDLLSQSILTEFGSIRARRDRRPACPALPCPGA